MSVLLNRRIAATAQAVDQFCAELRQIEQIPLAERFAVELLAREALINAVLHGAGSAEDGAREVWCEVEWIGCGVAVRVHDSGPGFDWRHYLHSEPDVEAESGRGIPILRRYTSALRFNQKGNQLEAVRIFREVQENGKL
jgi:anti-sigma regulatory factor (Ser/Thr protein kinase)